MDEHPSLINFCLHNAWAAFELFVTAILVSLLVVYEDADDALKLLTRGYVVFALWTYFIGSIHILAVRRQMHRIALENALIPEVQIKKADYLPVWAVSLFFVFRLGIVCLFVWWMCHNQLLNQMLSNKAVDLTATRVTPPAGQESRHGQP